MFNFGKSFRQALTRGDVLAAPGVYDLLSATIAGQQYGVLLVGGEGMGAAQHGLPDLGLVSWSDLLGLAQRIRHVMPRHHLLVDLGGGYYSREILTHLTAALCTAGASGVLVDDRLASPADGTPGGILSISDFLATLDCLAAVRGEMVLVARTWAAERKEINRRILGLIDSKAGVDVVMPAGARLPADVDVGSKLGRAKIAAAVMQPGGTASMNCSLSELRAAGIRLVVYPSVMLRSATVGMQQSLGSMKSTDGRPPTTGEVPQGEALDDILRDNLRCRDDGTRGAVVSLFDIRKDSVAS